VIEDDDIEETEQHFYGVDETDEFDTVCEATVLTDGRLLLRWVVLEK